MDEWMDGWMDECLISHYDKLHYIDNQIIR